MNEKIKGADVGRPRLQKLEPRGSGKTIRAYEGELAEFVAQQM
jgi:hypothetical protein